MKSTNKKSKNKDNRPNNKKEKRGKTMNTRICWNNLPSRVMPNSLNPLISSSLRNTLKTNWSTRIRSLTQRKHQREVFSQTWRRSFPFMRAWSKQNLLSRLSTSSQSTTTFNSTNNGKRPQRPAPQLWFWIQPQDKIFHSQLPSTDWLKSRATTSALVLMEPPWNPQRKRHWCWMYRKWPIDLTLDWLQLFFNWDPTSRSPTQSLIKLSLRARLRVRSTMLCSSLKSDY